MNLHYYRDIHSEIKDSSLEPIPAPSSDEEVIDFDAGDVCNADYDGEGYMTIYTDKEQWYITMSTRDLIRIVWMVIKTYIKYQF